MSIRDLFECIAASLVMPFLCAGAAAYHFFPKFAEDFAAAVADHGRVAARVLSASESGELVIQFRIEREKKTVIQKCRVYSPPFGKRRKDYVRGDRITVYYRDGGTAAEAIPESDNRWEFFYELLRKLCVIFFAAGIAAALAAVIL